MSENDRRETPEGTGAADGGGAGGEGSGVASGAIAALAGGAGIAVVATLAVLPAGTGDGRALALAARVLVSGRFWGVLGIAAPALAGLLAAVSATLAHRSAATPVGVARALSPAVAGAGLGLGSLLLDPWWYRSTAPVLVALGAGLGALAAHRRWLRVVDDSGRPERRRVAARWAAWGLAAVAVAVPAIMALPGPPWWPDLSGDEPHYLVYAHSLWSDADLDLAADYVPEVYGDFYPAELSPHTKSGRDPASRYSIHSPGLPVWLAPWYAVALGMPPAGRVAVVRLAMCLWLGAFALVLYRILHDLAGARAALRGTAAVAFTGPLLFLAPHLFPDLPAATLSAAAYLLVRGGRSPRRGLLAGTLVALLPWLGVKFFALAGALAVAGAGLLWRGARGASGETGGVDDGSGPEVAGHGAGDDAADPGAPAAAAPIVAFLAPVALSAAAHLAFTWTLYGNLSPLSLYLGAGEQKVRAPGLGGDLASYLDRPWSIVTTAAALALDQKEGLLFVAPHLLLAAAGFVWLWRRHRAEAFALGGILAAHWGTYALSQEVGGWSPPARPAVAAIWTLAVPAGLALAIPAVGRSGRRFDRLRGGLVAAAVGLNLLYLARPDLLYHGYRVEHSRLLQHLGAPGLPLWELAPAWLGSEGSGPLVSTVWIALVALAGWCVVRWARETLDAGDGSALAGDGPERPDDEPRQAAGARGSPGRRGAAAVWLAGGLLLLAHHLLVPVSALHRPRDYGSLKAWTSTTPPERAWADPDGVWFRGEDVAWVPVSSSAPLEEVQVELSSLVAMRAAVQLGADGAEADLEPGRAAVFRLRPGEGVRWQGEWFVPLSVRAPEGASPAELDLDPNDRRRLGVYVRFLDVERGR